MTQTSTTARRPGQPVLSLTIPTYNRAAYLVELLESLLPQFAGLVPEAAELLISDNCSNDHTREVIAGFQQRGLSCRYVRNDSNIGADANFLQCLRLARGQYVWVIGDDDLLEPGAIAGLLDVLAQQEVDLVYLSSFAFSNSPAPAPPPPPPQDKLGRYAEHVIDGSYFLNRINALVGLISVMIVNKNRLEATPHPPFEQLADSNLMQVGWLFPLIHRRTSVLYVWKRLVAYRSYNSGGWGVCEVFGVRLERIAKQYFAAEPKLAQSLMNGVLRFWLFEAILEMRRGRHAEMNSENFAQDIRHLFHDNWRYWLFIYPVSEFPLPLAEAFHTVLSALNKISRSVSTLWRHWFRHGTYLAPRG